MAISEVCKMETSNALTVEEDERLKHLEEVVLINLRAFYEVGTALLEIRKSRLYRNTRETFEDYCRERWDMTRDYAYKLIGSSKVVDNLDVDNCIQKPMTESQARPLTRLSAPLQIEAWKKVVETAPEGRITASHVCSVVDEIEASAHPQTETGHMLAETTELNEWPTCSRCKKEDVAYATRGKRAKEGLPNEDGLCFDCRREIAQEKENLERKKFEQIPIDPNAEKYWQNHILKMKEAFDPQEAIIGKVSEGTLNEVSELYKFFSTALIDLRNKSSWSPG